MKTKLMKLSKTPTIKNIMIVATGTAAAQVISVAFSPVITRLYGPEAFGILGVFLSMLAIIKPIAALTYPVAIVLPKSNTEAKTIARLSLYISIIMSVLIALILVFFNDWIVFFLQVELIAPYLILVPLVILFSGLLQVARQWLIRTKQFRVSAKIAFFQALLLNSAKVGIGWFNPVASVLIILTTLGDALHAIMLLIGANRSRNKQIEEEFDTQISYRAVAKKYIDFPLYKAPQTFINAISQNLPVILLASFFGPTSVGFYSIGRTVLSMPTRLIGNSVGDVIYPRIAETANNGESITQLVKKATLSLVAVGILPFGIVILFGPSLFSFVFGPDWVFAGEYARWIALWSFFMFINNPSLKALPVMSAQSFHLRFTLFTLIARVSALAVGYYVFTSDLVAVALFGVAGSIINLILILITLEKGKKFDKLNRN